MSHGSVTADAGSWRSIVEFIVTVTVTVLICRTWVLEGFVVPTASMAGTIAGLHRDVVCGDCGWRFSCGSDVRPVGPRAVCPNCGYARNRLDEQPDVSGDRVMVFKAAYALRNPQRWEVIVFRSPEEAERVFVKRVVAMPGEQVEIRDGDIYIDGQIARKSLSQQRAMAVPVHDARFPPAHSPELPSRWSGENPDTGWQRQGNRFLCTQESIDTAASPEPTDWLTYRHWRRNTSTPGGYEETPVVDDCGYNQNTPRHPDEYRPVRDLMLVCRVEAHGAGAFSLHATDGRDRFLVRMLPTTGHAELQHNGQLVLVGTMDLAPLESGAELEFSLVDRQVMLALGGRLLFAYEFQAADIPGQPTSRPLALGTAGLSVEVADLRVLRDVYYTRPPLTYSRWGIDEPYHLGDDEFFALGDNSPMSQDSRLWTSGPAIPRRLLVGKPIVVHLPSRSVDWGGTPFQVPDIARIRYIR